MILWILFWQAVNEFSMFSLGLCHLKINSIDWFQLSGNALIWQTKTLFNKRTYYFNTTVPLLFRLKSQSSTPKNEYTNSSLTSLSDRGASGRTFFWHGIPVLVFALSPNLICCSEVHRLAKHKPLKIVGSLIWKIGLVKKHRCNVQPTVIRG